MKLFNPTVFEDYLKTMNYKTQLWEASLLETDLHTMEWQKESKLRKIRKAYSIQMIILLDSPCFRVPKSVILDTSNLLSLIKIS